LPLVLNKMDITSHLISIDANSKLKCTQIQNPLECQHKSSLFEMSYLERTQSHTQICSYNSIQQVVLVKLDTKEQHTIIYIMAGNCCGKLDAFVWTRASFTNWSWNSVMRVKSQSLVVGDHHAHPVCKFGST
jgi:hypothetical protein